MSELRVCDNCEETVTQLQQDSDPETKMFDVTWSAEGVVLSGDICEDCLPQSVMDSLSEEHWDADNALSIS
jgi:hypothetical protein